MIRVDEEGDLRIVTLDRVDKANALTRSMLTDLVDATRAARGAKTVIFTGVGGVFSAGADLEEARAGLATDPLWERLSASVAALPGLTIAALNGSAAGGSLGLVLACDLRVAVPAARIFYPVMKLGFAPQPSDPVRLRALVGPAGAKRVLLAGEKLAADEALRIGLLDEIAEDPLTRARALCADALSADRAHVRALKGMIPD